MKIGFGWADFIPLIVHHVKCPVLIELSNFDSHRNHAIDTTAYLLLMYLVTYVGF